MNKRMRSNLINALLIVLIGICLGIIAALALPYLASDQKTDEIQEAYVVDKPAEEAPAEYPTINWDELLARNPDVVAWVHVPGTTISYPVVKAAESDPDFYLNHDIDRSYDFAGTPYLDAKCQSDFTSFNSVISGHHLINDTMFSPFSDYSRREFFEEHRTIYLLTPTDNIKLNAVSVNVGSGSSLIKRVEFGSYNDFVGYWQDQLKQSVIVADDAPTYPFRTFCFVTCSYQTNNSRTLVYATVSGEDFGENQATAAPINQLNG